MIQLQLTHWSQKRRYLFAWYLRFLISLLTMILAFHSSSIGTNRPTQGRLGPLLLGQPCLRQMAMNWTPHENIPGQLSCLRVLQAKELMAIQTAKTTIRFWPCPSHSTGNHWFTMLMQNNGMKPSLCSTRFQPWKQPSQSDSNSTSMSVILRSPIPMAQPDWFVALSSASRLTKRKM